MSNTPERRIIFTEKELEEKIPGIQKHLKENFFLSVHRQTILPSPEERVRFLGGSLGAKEKIDEHRPNAHMLYLLFEACRYIPNTPQGIVDFADYLGMRVFRRSVLKTAQDHITNPDPLYTETFRTVGITNFSKVLRREGYWKLIPSVGFLTISR